MDRLEVKLMSPQAVVPTRGSVFAAGYDIYACEDKAIPPLQRCMVDTGIAIAVPPGTYGRVAPRSGLAYKNGIDVLAGVIDEDYRGVVKVILFNTDRDMPVFIKAGDRIAQLILEECRRADIMCVDELSETSRGGSGFGSTGN